MTTKLISLCLVAGPLVLLNACGKQQNEPSANAALEKPAAVKAITDSEMGLSKTSVFDTPDPQAVNYSETFPGSNALLSRAYPDAPPQIPHNIESFKPITAKNNACVGCHHNPSMRGKEVTQGMATPMSASHYTDLRHKPGTVTEQLIGARYVCTQCHAMQANVDQLVENTFQSVTQK